MFKDCNKILVLNMWDTLRRIQKCLEVIAVVSRQYPFASGNIRHTMYPSSRRLIGLDIGAKHTLMSLGVLLTCSLILGQTTGEK